MSEIMRGFASGKWTHDGFPALTFPDGSHATELGMTVTDPRLNAGQPTNIPSLWRRQIVPEEMAVLEALASGKSWPSYRSIAEAIAASKLRSSQGGAGQNSWQPDYLTQQQKDFIPRLK